jgi:short-subunit dehydrogenase
VLALAFALRAEAASAGVKVSLLLAGGTQTAVVDSARRVPPDGGEIIFRDDLPQPNPPLLISPDEVAARTVAGLKADEALIVTHAGMRPLVEEYFNRILTAYDNAAAWRAEEAWSARRIPET